MGLDIRISRAKEVRCPHCGELVTYEKLETVDLSGRYWTDFLKHVGYYPADNEAENWYAEDMILTDEQVNYMVDWVYENCDWWYNPINFIVNEVPRRQEYKDVDTVIIINADW